MASSYTVKQGDHLSSIAKDFGFSDYKTIWNHADNAELKQLRQNPNVLFPGDIVHIPDHEHRLEPKPTEVRHKFISHQPTLRLRLVLEDLFEKPIANAECDLLLGSETRQVTTDGDGKIDEKIKPDTKTAQLVIKDPQTPFQQTVFPIKIGHLDPIDEITGQVARLENLGYFPGDPSGSDKADFQSAVEEFQCDQGLTVDGKFGPETQAKLKEVYGC